MAEENKKVVFKHNANIDGIPCFVGDEKELTVEQAKKATQAKAPDGSAVAAYFNAPKNDGKDK